MTVPNRPTRAVNCTNQYDEGVLQQRDPSATIDWDVVLDRLPTADTCWLTTLTAGGEPHTRPVLSVVVDGSLYTSSSRSARKFAALEAGRTCSLAASTDGLDIVWAARPQLVDDREELDRVAGAYRSVHGWDVTAVPPGLDAPYGAPTAGPPPYAVVRLDPIAVHGLGTDETLAGRSTRWEFDRRADRDVQVAVAGSLHVDPVRRDAYLDTCGPVVRQARATDGCLDFAIGADLVDPGRINVFERWRDRASLAAFRADGPSDDQDEMLIDVRIVEHELLA